jgi:hypothetical protein
VAAVARDSGEKLIEDDVELRGAVAGLDISDYANSTGVLGREAEELPESRAGNPS